MHATIVYTTLMVPIPLLYLKGAGLENAFLQFPTARFRAALDNTQDMVAALAHTHTHTYSGKRFRDSKKPSIPALLIRSFGAVSTAQHSISLAGGYSWHRLKIKQA